MQDSRESAVIAVVIPCYKVSSNLQHVVAAMPALVDLIYCVDDCCPENSTQAVESQSQNDHRIKVLKRESNGGVGAAVITGYRQALGDGADIIVKLDGDGQMDPALIPLFVAEIAEGRADYVKGNRFYTLEAARTMPFRRKVGNMGLSFFTKLSTGYWQLFDPNNGFTAIHANILKVLQLDKIAPRFFFESDMLFNLGLLRARVVEVPMNALYGDEKSNLNDMRALYSFPLKNGRNFFKRIFYEYFLRNFSIASLELLVGIVFVLFGMIFGINAWINTAQTGQPATAGTVMLASLPTIIGIQFVLNFFAHDMAREPSQAVHNRLSPHIAPVGLGPKRK